MGLDTHALVRRALQSAETYHADADACLITVDLTGKDDVDSDRALKAHIYAASARLCLLGGSTQNLGVKRRHRQAGVAASHAGAPFT